MIPLPKLSQRDPAWFDKTMGQSGQTLGMQGCTLTAGCMASYAFGKGMQPSQAVAAMNAIGGFDESGSLSWLAFAKVLGLDWGFRYDTTANQAPNHLLYNEADALRHIERNASWGFPSICWVDTDHDGKANHWVVYVGDGQCNDPWDGQQKDFSSVFKRLYGVAIFNGTPTLTGGKIGQLIGKANEASHRRNLDLNLSEMMDAINKP